jgi:hypothetical protein
MGTQEIQGVQDIDHGRWKHMGPGQIVLDSRPSEERKGGEVRTWEGSRTNNGTDKFCHEKVYGRAREDGGMLRKDMMTEALWSTRSSTWGAG